MNAEWSPIVVAIISAVVGVIALVVSRSEPRRAKELVALKTILDDAPEGDPGFEALRAYRSRLAAAYSERSVTADPALVTVGVLSTGWALLAASAFMTQWWSGAPAEAVEAAALGLSAVLGGAGLVISFVGLVVLALCMFLGARRVWVRFRRGSAVRSKNAGTTGDADG